MKFCLISDTHGHHRKIDIPKDCDAILFAGDMTKRGEPALLADFAAWTEELGKPFVAIAGNHDLSLDKDTSLEPLLDNLCYLRDSSVEFDGIKIYGSPMAKKIGVWAFGYQTDGEAKEYWDLIPDDTDILITHGPPLGMLDKLYYGGERVGCPVLLKAIDRVKPKLHLFGHIHERWGIIKSHPTIFVNASICTWPGVAPTNKPFVLNIG